MLAGSRAICSVWWPMKWGLAPSLACLGSLLRGLYYQPWNTSTAKLCVCACVWTPRAQQKQMFLQLRPGFSASFEKTSSKKHYLEGCYQSLHWEFAGECLHVDIWEWQLLEFRFLVWLLVSLKESNTVCLRGACVGTAAAVHTVPVSSSSWLSQVPGALARSVES